MLNLLIILLLLNYTNSFQPIIKTLNYDENYQFTINDSIEYILRFSPKFIEHVPARVTISSDNANTSAPLMIVAKQPQQLLSWQLPLIIESDSGLKVFNQTSRTLCYDLTKKPHQFYQKSDGFYNPSLMITTDSVENVTFEIYVNYEENFFINPSIFYNFTITPSEPRFYYYNFTMNATKRSVENNDENYETVILEVLSDDDVCMTVSIQNITCPVFDTNEDITFRGFYETVDFKGGITIPKDKFPYGFFMVFVAKSDNYDCTGQITTSKQNGIKNISLIIKPSISYHEYLTAVIITLCVIGGFYIVFGTSFFYCSYRHFIPRQMEYVSSSSTTSEVVLNNDQLSGDSISVDETEYDTIGEVETDRRLRLGKSTLYLSDLARKDPRVLKHKSYLYLYNVLTVALFYGLPAIQLVITYQRVLNQTGEQDLCYYNFLCAHPLGVISDFNHLFSNIGYISFGLLFLWITYRREITHKDLDFDRQYGIPQHYGMFYAMGVSLIMEGILSGSYHICPNQSNFQFDSSFMYVMAVLCMVKLYQNRHPDINATACTTFGVLAIAILLGMIGILEGNLYFWIIFTIIYLVGCLYLSAQIYYMGCWRLDRGVFMRIYQNCTNDFHSGPLNIFKPNHKARMCLLIIGNLCNFALAGWGVYQHRKDFALFLLTIFMSNTLLYFFFYIVMKFFSKERVNKLALFFLLISVICACSAMYFFLHKSISWSKTPAESRRYNQECKLLRFYDYHDIWHFLSAVGMFFTFMVLLTLDDDLSHTHRNQILVF